jgi:hypothetical protein
MRKLTRAGLFMNGRALLFSAFKATLARLAVVAGAKAEADPTRRVAARAAIFTILTIQSNVDMRCLGAFHRAMVTFVFLHASSNNRLPTT